MVSDLPRFDNVLIIGVGLIGASIAMALKKKSAVKKIIGLDPKPENCEIIDFFIQDLKEVIHEVDLIVLATPSAALPSIFKTLNLYSPQIKANLLILDVASVKEPVVAFAKKYLGEINACFVPCHPIAGKALSGSLQAEDNLFQGKPVIITPFEKTKESKIKQAEEFWEILGVKVIKLSPIRHDEILATTSHLPQILAYALMLTTMDLIPKNNERYSGSGFESMTRLAASDPALWVDICAANQEAILQSLESFEQHLTKIIQLVKQKKWSDLKNHFSQAAREKNKK